ncbi:MAG: hypothetical protein ACSHX5_12255 [Phycisphaerales bacterium]
MNTSTGIKSAIVAAVSVASVAGAGVSPFATSVLSYDSGSNAVAGYTDASTALGSAERFTGEGVFPSGVTPFNPAFGTDEIVSIGAGGHLSLGFDRAITNSASHVFGVDLIIFSNAGFSDTTWTDADPNNDGTGFTGANPFIFGGGGAATVQVSADGINWITATTTTLDLFPTLGYSDFTDATPFTPGSVESDFTLALDPTLTAADMANMSFDDIRDFYNGSGGGVGIDIASTGLSSASFVRFLNESGEAFEIDAVAVVPAPSALMIASVFGFGAMRRRR